MFHTQAFSTFLLALLLFCPSASAKDISLEQLMMLHDLMPNEALKIDIQLPSSSKLESRSPATTFSLQTIKQPIRVLIDVRSTHSDGSHDFKTLIDLAKKRHIQSLAFTEHDRYTIRFGIDPIPHVFGYSQEHPSLYQTGLEQFFSDLNAVQQQDIILFAGTESTPGYSWQGIPFKNLSLHNAERHFITLGAKKPSQIQNLSSYNLKHGYGNKELSLIFWFTSIFVLIFVLLRRRKRSIALLVAGSFIAFMTTWLMKPIVDPDQDFIRTAHQENLFVIWTHPGTLSGVREGPMGVQLNTPPYNALVFESPTADGFAAIYGDTDSNTIPGGLWDQFMMGYMAGYHPKPIWAVAAGDYHEEGQSGEFLGNFPMDVWAESAQVDDILKALKQGRMASWQMGKERNLSLQALSLAYINPETGERSLLFTGDEAVVPANIELIAAIHELGDTSSNLTLQGQWVVDGRVASHVTLSTKHNGTIQSTPLQLSKGRHVIRLQIPAQQGVRMETNPFLVQVR